MNDPITEVEEFITSMKSAGGDWFAPFQKIRDLEQGGEGKTSLYEHPFVGHVVLKEVRNHIPQTAIMRSNNPAQAARARPCIEAQLLHRLKPYRHKNIVRFLDYYQRIEEDVTGLPVLYESLALGYCDAGDLHNLKSSYVDEGRSFPEGLVWSIITQMDSALAFLHEGHGTPHYRSDWIPIIHRDIKPENVLLQKVPGSEWPHVRIIDFGLSTAMKDPEDFDYRISDVFGSPEYQPPEHPEAYPAGDMWATGAVIHFLCLAEPPLDAKCQDSEYISLPKMEYDAWLRTLEHKRIAINIPPSARAMQWATGNATESWECTYSDLLNWWMEQRLKTDWRARLKAVDAVESMGSRFQGYKEGRSVQEFGDYVKKIPVVIPVLAAEIEDDGMDVYEADFEMGGL